MAWNDPGNGKDPWKRGDEEPNDLDKIVQNWQRRLGGLFGGGKAGAGRRKAGSGGGGWFILLFALVAWALTGPPAPAPGVVVATVVWQTCAAISGTSAARALYCVESLSANGLPPACAGRPIDLDSTSPPDLFA
jgi:hypothetical protein